MRMTTKVATRGMCLSWGHDCGAWPLEIMGVSGTLRVWYLAATGYVGGFRASGSAKARWPR